MSPRVEPIHPPYTPEVQASLEKWMPPGSALEPLKLFRTLARHPHLRDRMRPLGSAFLGHGLLPARVRELVVLRACARCTCEYEWGVHVSAFAAAVGLDEVTIRTTALAPPEALAGRDDLDGLVLRAVDELHDTSNVHERTWTALEAHLDPASLLELLALAGFYHLISFVTNGAGVEHEDWAARFPEESTRRQES